MGYNFKIKDSYRLDEQKLTADELINGKKYPWPCKSEPNRTLTIFKEDLLHRNKDKKYSKITGLATFGHIIPDDDLVFEKETKNMRVL